MGGLLPAAPLLDLLRRVRDGSDEAWKDFLDAFAPLLLQAASCVERDPDHAADAFVYACEQLRAKRGLRLATYDPQRPGSFEGWLRTVAVNLARDARRRRVGRLRALACIGALPRLERRVFHCRYEAGLTIEQTFALLVGEFPDVTERRVAAIDERLTSRAAALQQLRRIARRVAPASFDPRIHPEPLDPAPDPEWQVLSREWREQLGAALAALSDDERLLLRYRFDRNLTLAALATVFGAPSPQAMDRRLRAVLDKVRAHLVETGEIGLARP